ncbi:MAG: succinate dehydrogenase iron-sulfur subunit [Planctomycetota bacterium]
MIEFKVFRFNPEKDKTSRFDNFQVPWEKGMTVLEGLLYIFDNLDASLSFRSSCRAAVCGSCAMHINGKYRLACNTLIESLVKSKDGIITIRPLAHLPVYKDLVVDMTNFFKNYESIKPYLIPAETLPPKEFIQLPSDRKKIDGAIDCILCGACYGSCPVAGTNPDYVGPHSILKTLRFYNDSRDTAKKERLGLIGNNHGIFRCHSIFNCQVVCPKNLDPGDAISKMKMSVTWFKLKKIFGL